ncbi:MAG TPA: TonB-dependent receptor [Gemmatimonadales bacterium]
MVSSAAVAQVRPDSAARDSVGQRVAPVVVTGKRTPITVGGAGAVVVELDSMRLPAAPVLDQALREIPFVLVRRNSRGEMELSVRGSDSRQAAVLVDGIPITLGWDHRTDPSLVPLTGARSITVTRGLSSLLHGPNVLGGVVEVDVTRGSDSGARTRRSLSLATDVDQLGGHGLSISGATPLDTAGRWTLRAGAAWRDRPGLALSGGVPSIGADPDLRTNSDLRHLDGFAALRWRGDGGRFAGLTASAYRAERGVPPELHVAEPRLWRYPDQHRLLATLGAGTGTVDTPFGFGSLQASVGYNGGRTEIESFATTAYDRVVGTEAGDERTLTARLAGEHSLPGRMSLRAAATLADATYDELLGDDPAARYRQRLWSVGSELLAPVGGGATQLVGGLVMDGADTPATGGRPPLGALSRWGGRLGVTSVVGSGVRVHASVSQRARFPALRELYSGALGRFEPNPELRPERLVGTEAGMTGMLGAVELQGVAFHHRLHDAVVRVTTEDRRFRRENRDEIRSSGVELLGSWRGRSGVFLSGDLMAQRVRLIDVIDGGTRHAEHQPELRAGLGAGTPLPLGLTGAAGVRYTGAQYCVHPDRDTEVRLDGRAWGDLSVARGWSLGRAATALFRTLVATLSIDNVTDAAIYDQCGLPQPGRTVRVMVEVR